MTFYGSTSCIFLKKNCHKFRGDMVLTTIMGFKDNIAIPGGLPCSNPRSCPFPENSRAGRHQRLSTNHHLRSIFPPAVVLHGCFDIGIRRCRLVVMVGALPQLLAGTHLALILVFTCTINHFVGQRLIRFAGSHLAQEFLTFNFIVTTFPITITTIFIIVN